jgi:hypothetical protein
MLQIANILSGTHRSNHIPEHGMQRTETRSINKQVKGKAIPIQSQIGPESSRRFRLPGFSDSRHKNVARLSATRTDRFQPPKKFPHTHFCQNPSRPQGHSPAGSIRSIKVSRPQRESSPRPSFLQRSVSTKCATAYPHIKEIMLKHKCC